MTYLDTLDLQAEMALGRLNAAARRKRGRGNDLLLDAMKAIIRDAYWAGAEDERAAQGKGTEPDR